MRALGAYIFAGGFTVGVSRHFDVVGHLEGNDYGVETARLNWPKMPIRYGKEKWDVTDPSFSELDFIYANPPCAIFSPMGIVTTQGAGSWKTDPRLDCWKNAVELVDILKPRAFALESVTQAYTRGRELIDEFTRYGLDRGYSVTHLLLDAKWTGIPQSRKRFFLVFHRAPKLVGYQFNFSPPPTIGEVLETIDEPGYILKRTRSDFAANLDATRPGERLLHGWERLHPQDTWKRNERGHVIGRPSFGDRRLELNEVMGAWIGDKFYHPVEPRPIGLNESKAICGYPQDFKIAPKDLRGFGSLLARAVMPPVGEWLARAIAATLRGDGGDLRVHLVDVREPGVEPIDLTDDYIDRDSGKLLRHVIPARAAIDEDEDEELTPATSASTLHGPEETAPRKDAGTTSRDVPSVHGHEPSGEAERHRVGDAASVSLAPRGDASAEVAPASADVYAVVAAITGFERDDVKRAIIALGYAMSIPQAERYGRIANATGLSATGVERIDAAFTIMMSSPAGKPAATPVARLPEEPVAPSRSTVLESRSADAGEKPAKRETSRERAVKPQAGYTPGDDDPKPKEGEGSGVFIRRMLMADTHTPEQIVGLVLANYEGRKTTVKDVYWNYQRLIRDGVTPPAWRSAKMPGGYPGAKPSADVRSTTLPPAGRTDLMVEAANNLVFRPSAARVVNEPLKRVAIVEWHPRVCGSVTFGYELSKAMAGADRITFSKSGKSLATHTSPWRWNTYRIADAAKVLSEYDAVFLVDVACFAPDVSDGKPYYLDVLDALTVPFSGMFHGGSYPSKHTETMKRFIAAPMFTGSLVTTRLAQAEARFASVGSVRFVHNPYLPYDTAWGGTLRTKKIRAVAMTARIATNKGQNALMAVANDLIGNSIVSGCSAYGLPSTAWNLYRLGRSLGYSGDEPLPSIPTENNNVKRFHTGTFELTTPSGRRFEYRGAYNGSAAADWSPWLHASLPSREFGDTLEYVTLDAIAAGSVAIVPETSIVEAHYDTLVTVPYQGCSLWANDAGEVRGKDFDRRALVEVINGLLKRSSADLSGVAERQLAEVRAKHAPELMWKSVEQALRGGGE